MITRAQGTIEYLVIIAVVVVLSLVVVGLLVNQTSSAGNISASVSKISSSSGLLSVSETVEDVSGNGLITLTNNSGGTLVLTKITVGDNNRLFYNIPLSQGIKKTFSLRSISLGCSCVGFEGKTKTCPVTIYTTSEYGLEKQFTTSVSVNCISSAIAINPLVVVQPAEFPYIIYPVGSKLYIHPTDSSASAEYGCIFTYYGPSAQSDTNGIANTARIVALCSTAGIAARICSDLNSYGYDDWYLPAKNQLSAMYVDGNNVVEGAYATQWVNFGASHYWSSTEMAGYSQYGGEINFSNGTFTNNNKNIYYNVRCVRGG